MRGDHHVFPPNYDEAAAQRVRRVEDAIQALELSEEDGVCVTGNCMAITNAIERQVQDGAPHAPTVFLLVKALKVYVRSLGADPDRTEVSKLLEEVLCHVPGYVATR